MNPLELKSLIDGCINNSRQHQKKLYDTYSPFVYGIIVKNFNDKNYAYDILNETFIKVFRDISKYSYTGAFEAWLRRITINTIVDHVRINKKHNNSLETEDVVILVKPNDTLSYKELLNVINTLPATQKLVFNLFVMENYSHKEIATALGISEVNSRFMLNDARKRLKSKLEKLN